MFDPLHKWLGIPPEEQPPHNYRLLGIALFEEDTDVIDAAADKQLAFLHDLTNGQYGEQAEQLSNQISAARLCLLNSEKKQAYDSVLRRQLQSGASLEAKPSSDSPVTSQTPTHGAGTTVPQSQVDGPAVRVKRRRAKQRPPSGLPTMLRYSTTLCIVVLVLIGIGIRQGRIMIDHPLLTKIGLVPVVEPTRPSKATDVTESPPETPAAQEMPQPPSTPNSEPPSANATTGDQTPVDPQPMAESAEKQSPAPPEQRSLADLLYPNSSDQGETGQAITKAAYPSKGELDAKMDLIRELHEDKYRAARTSKDKLELARLMHREGQQSSDDPVGRFGLWRVSRDIFMQQGEFNAALDVVDNLDTHYEGVDANQMRVETLRDSAGLLDPSRISEFMKAVAEVVDRCDRDEDYEPANLLCDFLSQKLGASLNEAQQAELEQSAAKIRLMATAHQRFQTAAAALETSDDDPEANQAVGYYLCFLRGDWPRGLGHLAHGNDELTREAAARDADDPATVADAIMIADAWYKVALSEPEPTARQAIVRRAMHWYQTAQPNAKGLDRTKADARIAALSQELPAQDEQEDRSAAATDSKLLGHRVLTSSESRQDYAERKGNEFTIGMGPRVDGIGEAQAGIELQDVKTLSVAGSASHKMMPNVNALTKSGFVIDYHTPGGYTRRVFLGLGLHPGREFTDAPPWGAAKQPDITTDIGRNHTYEIDLTRWAPSTWDGRCWFSIYMQNGGPDRSLQAKVSW